MRVWRAGDARHDRDRRRRDRRRRRRARLRAARAGRPRRGARRPAARLQPPGHRHHGDRGAAVRVVIADDNLLVRKGIAALLTDAGIDVAARGRRPRTSCSTPSPSTSPTSRSSTSACRPPRPTRGSSPRTRSASATPASRSSSCRQHVEHGVATRVLAEDPARLGYLLKDRVTDIDDFVGTLRRVAAGGTALDPQVVSRLLDAGGDDGPLDALTPREREVLQLLAEGCSNPAIAARARDHAAQRREARVGDLRQARAPGHRHRGPPRARRPAVTCTA